MSDRGFHIYPPQNYTVTNPNPSIDDSRTANQSTGLCLCPLSRDIPGASQPHPCGAPPPLPPYLDDEGLVGEARAEAQLAHVGGLVDEVLDAVEDAAARGGDPAVDAALADGLAGHTGVGVDILGTTHTRTRTR